MKDISFERSFASHPKSKYWSKLNELKPEQVYKSSKDKCWFDCHECYHSFDLSPDKIIYANQWCFYCSNSRLCEKECVFCFEKSFASHPNSKYWSNLNDLKPRQVFKSSHKKYKFNCDKCNHIFDIQLNSITNKNNWCNYCSNNILCDKEDCKDCFNKSFASHPKSKFWSDQNEINHRQLFKSSHKRYKFDCDKCNHVFDGQLKSINNNIWCPYCCFPPQKLCENNNCKNCFENSFASHSKSKFWSDQNEINPRHVFRCGNKKFWFDCNKCNNTFDCSLNNIINNTWCPKCKNKTELKLFEWIKEQNFEVQTQVKFDWCKNINHLPFDFLLEEFKLIFELDGAQHFEQVSNWQSPDESKIRDNFKNKMAIENGYSIIRICQRIVLNDLEDWENQLKQVIKKYDNPKLIKIGNIYN